MSGRRVVGWSVLVLAIAAGLLAWTLIEAGRQRRQVESALVEEASLVAAALGPGLGAASAAARELDEIVLGRLLDNARLLAELEPTRLDEVELAALLEANGLDTVAVFDGSGNPLLEVGQPMPEETFDGLGDLLSGRADETVLGTTVPGEVEHLTAGVRGPTGRVVLVQVHASAVRTFASQLGVPSLLAELVDAAGVLYLSYREAPGNLVIERSWDGQPVPSAGRVGLRRVRERTAFETEVPLEAPAGLRATLRVGLDGTPLARAAAAAQRRTLLVGLVLLGFTVAGIGYAVVGLLRARERAEAARCLAEVDEARRRSERLAAAGALTSGLAHEVRSPLNAIGLAAQRLERRLAGDGESRELAGRVRSEVLRLERTLREFLELARPVSEDRQACDLADLCRDVVELLAVEAESCGVSVGPVEGRVVAPVDCEAVRRAILNLLRNGLQASRAEGRVEVEVSESGDDGLIRILDRGHGLDPKLSGRLFDAFVTGRASGTGLGLAQVRRVAEEHGGSIRLSDRKGGGAVAELRLPMERRG